MAFIGEGSTAPLFWWTFYCRKELLCIIHTKMLTFIKEESMSSSPGLLRCLRRAEEHLDPASELKRRLPAASPSTLPRSPGSTVAASDLFPETGPPTPVDPALAADGRTGRAHVLRHHVSDGTQFEKDCRLIQKQAVSRRDERITSPRRRD